MSDTFIMIPEYAGKILKLKHDELDDFSRVRGLNNDY